MVPLNRQIGGKATFTEDGSFTVPLGVTEIYITAIAAGGNGYIDYDGYSGEFVFRKKFNVNAGDSLAVTVGSGNTVVGTILTLLKAGNIPSNGVINSHGILGIGGSDCGYHSNGIYTAGFPGYGAGGGRGTQIHGSGAPGVVVIEW